MSRFQLAWVHVLTFNWAAATVEFEAILGVIRTCATVIISPLDHLYKYMQALCSILDGNVRAGLDLLEEVSASDCPTHHEGGIKHDDLGQSGSPLLPWHI